MPPRKIMIVSGEESGERYGAMLVKAIRKRSEDVEFSGMGGQEMRRAGVDLICDIKDVSVVGLIEVLSNLSSVLKALKSLKKRLRGDKHDLLILIDFPDFNMRLAKFAKKLGIKILYFISPQIWAWRKRRVKMLSSLVDRMIVIFPFETDFYKKAGIQVEFVGHPLLDVMDVNDKKDSIREEMSLMDGQRLIGLLPGSRKSEVSRILPIMLQGAKILQEDFPDLRFVIPAARGLVKGFIEATLEKTDDLKPFIFYDRYYEVIEAIDLGIVASGTATVEMAMLQKPMVIVYKLHPLTYFIGRMFVKIENFGMANLIAGKEIVPELLQAQFNAESLYENVKIFLEDGQKVEKVRKELNKVKEKLGSKGMFERSAEIILNML
jgi:lipid-A-disaccharide synthase